MQDRHWTLRSRRVVTPSGVVAADVLIRNETIVGLAAHEGLDREGVILDAGDLAVLPGLVALHRIGSGRFEAATEDARAGGVTTLIDLPSDGTAAANSPEAFRDRMVAAEGKIRVDCGLVAGQGASPDRPVAPWIEAGALGVEAFLGPHEPGSARASAESDLRSSMAQLVRLGRPLLVHSGRVGRPVGPAGFADALPGPEYDALRLLVRLCRETRCPVLLIQPSGSEALPMIAEARAERLPLWVATCPGHLANAARVAHPGSSGPGSDSGSGSGSSRAGGVRLWEGLASGLVDVIGPDLRGVPLDEPDLDEPGPLRVALTTAWAEARRRGSTLEQLARWMAGRPAELFGLADRKGSIVPGLDADLVIFDPDAPGPDRHGAGRVEATILRGTLIAMPGQSFDHPTGAVVLRLEETSPMSIVRN